MTGLGRTGTIAVTDTRRLVTDGHRVTRVEPHDADVAGDVGTEARTKNTQRSGGGR